jgi:peptidoglycan/LPS O-acetylase OafA/YrhL
MPNFENRNHYFPTLDGWRAIAILGVILAHSTTFLFSPEESRNILFRAFILGSSGVDLFFAISGFLICSKILEREKIFGKIDIFHFYWRRIFRIFPLYFFYLFFLYALVALSWLNIPKEQIHSSLIFLQNYQISAASWHYALAHFWSLAVEEHFYLFFPLILFFLPKSSTNRISIFLALAAVFAIWRFLDFRYGFVNSILPNLSFFMRSDIRMDAILWGCVGAFVYDFAKTRKWLEKVVSFPGSSLFFFSIFLLVPLLDIPFSLSIRGIAAILLLLSTISNPKSWGFLDWGWLRLIGVMSYSLYVWNSFFLWPSYLETIPYIGFIQRAPFNYIFLFLTSYLTYRFLEKPMLRLGTKLWRN